MMRPLGRRPRAQTTASPWRMDPMRMDRDAELADKVVLDAWDLQKWRLRTPDRGAMLRAGMGYAEVDAAIAAWRALDEPKTAWER